MELENIYTGNIIVADLDSGEVEEVELEEEMVEKYLGGAALNKALYEEYKDRDPVILGCGPLTSTFTPCSGLTVLTGRSPLTGEICHVPLNFSSAEFKLTGFDFLVILGKSASPVCLWLHDEIADLDDASDLWGLDTWKACDAMRVKYGDDFIQTFMIGPACEAGSPLGQISENYWGSKDVFALGALLGEKKFKGIATRGLGTLEVADDFFEAAIDLKNEIVAGQLKDKHGFKDMLPAVGLQDSLGALFDEKQHRYEGNHACFFSYNTYFMIEDDPKLLPESKIEEPGVLALEISSLAALKDLGAEAPAVLREMQKLGLAPIAAAAVLAKQGITDAAAAKAELKKLASSTQTPADAGVDNIKGVPVCPIDVGEAGKLVQEAGLISNAIPPMPILGDFGLGDDPQEVADWCLKRQGVGYVLGIDPMILIMTPEYTDEKLVELIQLATEEEDFSVENLNEIVSEMLGK